MPNNAITGSEKRRAFGAPLFTAGYGERWVSRSLPLGSRYNLRFSPEASAVGNRLELLEAEALQLTAGERSAFAQLLLAILDEDAEIESGAVPVIPIADALVQVRASLK